MGQEPNLPMTYATDHVQCCNRSFVCLCHRLMLEATCLPVVHPSLYICVSLHSSVHPESLRTLYFINRFGGFNQIDSFGALWDIFEQMRC